MDIDDAEWDRWMDLTDAQQEAELAAAEAEYRESERAWEARTPRPLQYAHHRRSWLDLLAATRRRQREHPFLDVIWQESRKRQQMGMWKLRWWYRTGTYPPTA